MQLDNSLFFALVEEQLAEGRQVRIALKGTSMLPTLCEHDELILEPLRDEPSVGDVLLFRVGDYHIVHRLIRYADGLYTMQGDNNIDVEYARRDNLQARVVEVKRRNGSTVRTDSPEWQRISRRSLRRGRVKRWLYRWLGRGGRKQLRPWYFAVLAFLMWAPLNGLGIPLDNYILGLRADHLLHASVFLPCALFLMDLYGKKRRWAAWGTAVVVGLLTEGVQYLLPYRGYDVNDLIANTLGVTLGWMVVLLVLRRLRRR